jgi:hypothetical protein
MFIVKYIVGWFAILFFLVLIETGVAWFLLGTFAVIAIATFLVNVIVIAEEYNTPPSRPRDDDFQ